MGAWRWRSDEKRAGPNPATSLRRYGGVLIPLALHRLGRDPTVASPPFVTPVTDVVGFFSFLGIATLWFGLK